MTIQTRAQIRALLDKDGLLTAVVNKVSVKIEKRGEKYEITVVEPGENPSYWVYRSKGIALDRYEEQLANYRRVKA